MEFKSLKNIETSFRQIRLFTLVFASLCAVVTGFALWKSYSFAEAQRQKIYVLDNGKSLMLALSQDVRQNRPVEAREHVRRFHELFFTLSPDKSAIEGNIRRSLLLADKSAFNYYKDLSEKGYYNRIISGNINQMIEIDSLRCDFDKYPYSVRTFARQIILRESSVTERSLVTRCRLLDAVRSDNNRRASSSRASRSRRTRICRPSNADGHDRQVHHKGAGLGGREAPPPRRAYLARHACGNHPRDAGGVRRTVGLYDRRLHLPHRQERREGTGDRACQAPAIAQ